MYEAFFGLNTDPFRLRSDPRFSFAHPSYRRAKASLQYALRRAEGFVMVTGRPGTGKTTLIHDVMADLSPDEFVVGYLSVTQLGAEDLLRMAAHAFGVNADGTKKAQVLMRLMEFLEQKYRHSFQSLLIIDEAQDLPRAALEEIRLLNNLQHGGQPLVQIVLLGQEGLRELLRRPEMEQVHQRLIAAWHLEPLTPEETAEYVRHRLETAGWKGDPVLEPGVLPIVHEFSEGIPRRINLICSRLFLHAFVAESHSITQADAEEAARDLHDEELAQPLDDRKDAWPVAEDEMSQAASRSADESRKTDREPTPGAKAADPGVWTQIDQGLYGAEDRGPKPAAGKPAAAGEAGPPIATAAAPPKGTTPDVPPGKKTTTAAPPPKKTAPDVTPPKEAPTGAPPPKFAGTGKVKPDADAGAKPGNRADAKPGAGAKPGSGADVKPGAGAKPAVDADVQPGADAERKPTATKPREPVGRPAATPPKAAAGPASSRPPPKVTVYTVPLPEADERQAAHPTPKRGEAPGAKAGAPEWRRREPVLDTGLDEDALELSRDEPPAPDKPRREDQAPVPRITASPAVHIAAEREEARRPTEAHAPPQPHREGPPVSRRADRVSALVVILLFVATAAFAYYLLRSVPPDVEVDELPPPADALPPPPVAPVPDSEAAVPAALGSLAEQREPLRRPL